MESSTDGSTHLGGPGAALIVLGAVWFAVGAVLIVLALLYGGGPGSLPPSVDIDPNLFGAAPRSAAIGLFGVAAGAGQVVVGFAVTRAHGPLVARAALAAGVLGTALVGFWLVDGIAAGRPVLVLLPVVGAYLFVTWASAARDRVLG